MIKNKKIKKNWGKDDICILIWVISKYSNHLKIHEISEDLVIFLLFRNKMIGIKLLNVFRELLENLVNLDGSVCTKTNLLIKIGQITNLFF
jgi:hypothetical protein